MNTMSYFEELDEQQQALLLQHLDLVIEANKTTNLTRIATVEEAMTLHIEDSLSALPEMLEAPEGLYGDLGSGAGYPGIPLAVATGRNTTLIDARQKKMLLLDTMIQTMGLSDHVRTFAGRAELLARTEAATYAVLTARALSQLSVLMELASPLLERGGCIICYKSHVSDEEIAHARTIEPLVGMKLISDRSFTLEDANRRILVFEKTSTPKLKLPRLEGQAQKNPL